MTKFYETCYEAILAQCSSIANTIDAVDLSQIDTLCDKKHVVFMGCGDSYAVADYGQWCMSAAGISSVSLSPEEIRYMPIHGDMLVVGISASGRSLVTIDALNHAKSVGAETAVLTDNPRGRIVDTVDHIWTTRAGVSTYDTSPSSPTTTAMAYLLRLLGGMKNVYGAKVERDTKKLKRNGKKMMTWAEEEGRRMADLAQEDTALYFMSEGPNYVAAQIGMMKFNEYSLVRGFAALREEFRHHYHLAVKPTDSVVLISDSPTTPDDEVYMDVITDKLGLTIYNLHVREDSELETTLAQTIPNTIALQMAAYHNARQLNPDKTQFKEPHASAFKIY